MTQLNRMNENNAFNQHVPSCFVIAHIGELQFSEEALKTFEEVLKVINKLLK